MCTYTVPQQLVDAPTPSHSSVEQPSSIHAYMYIATIARQFVLGCMERTVRPDVTTECPARAPARLSVSTRLRESRHRLNCAFVFGHMI